MARIESDSLVAPKIFKGLRNEMDLTIAKDKELSAQLQKTLDLQVKIAKTAKRTAKGFMKIAAAEKKSVKALSEKEKIDKRILSLQQKLTKVSQIRQKREAALTVELQRRKKVLKEQAILENKNISAFERLNVKIKQQTARYQALIAQEGKETKKSRLLRKEIMKLTAVRATATAGVKAMNAGTQRSTGLFAKLKGGLVSLGIGFGVFQILRNGLGIIVDVDTALTNLTAITGKTAAEIEPLREQAFRLGETTQNTASEILALQLELAKLGFTTNEIVASTGGIQKFALATGATIPDAAKLAGSALRAFQLDATEMDRVVSVLAVATTKTALDFGFLQTAMSTIAPVANAFGFSIEDSTALLGQLANAGFDASSAATATRNILLNLADANGDLAKALGRPITSADDLAGALSELQAKGIDLATALELTDKRSVAAFETFLQGADSLVDLRDSITDVTGELDEMSAKKLDSISGATALLASAWEGLVLEWNEGAGAGEILKKVIQFIAKNLKSIVTTVLNVAKAFVIYKIAVLAANVATGKLFKTLKLNPFAAMASALFLLISLTGDWVKELKDANSKLSFNEEILGRINKEFATQIASVVRLAQRIRVAKEGTDEFVNAIESWNEKTGKSIEIGKGKADVLLQLRKAYAEVVKELREKIRLQVIENILTEQVTQIERLKLERKELQKNIENQKIDAFERLEAAKRLREIQREIFTLINRNRKIGIELGAKQIEQKKEEIDLEKDFKLKSDDTTKSIDKRAEALAKLREQQELEALIFENFLIGQGAKQTDIEEIMLLQRRRFLKEQLDLIRELYGEETIEFQKVNNEFLKTFIKTVKETVKEIETNLFDAMLGLRKQLKGAGVDLVDLEKKELELWKSIRKDIAETEKLFEQFMQNNIRLIDQQIEEQRRNFEESKSLEAELKQIAKEKGLDATESIQAEREAQKKALQEEQQLARKKAQIEALIVALRILAVRIEQGEGNPVTNITADILKLKNFVEGEFYEGTPYTLADALGHSPGRDSHVIAADNDESLFTGRQTKDLDIGKGKNSTQDIVDFYKSGILANSIRSSVDKTRVMEPNIVIENNSELIKEVKKLVQNTSPKYNPKEEMTFDAVEGVLKYQYKDRFTRKKRQYKV